MEMTTIPPKGIQRPSFAEQPFDGQESVWDYPGRKASVQRRMKLMIDLNHRFALDGLQHSSKSLQMKCGTFYLMRQLNCHWIAG